MSRRPRTSRRKPLTKAKVTLAQAVAWLNREGLSHEVKGPSDWVWVREEPVANGGRLTDAHMAMLLAVGGHYAPKAKCWIIVPR